MHKEKIIYKGQEIVVDTFDTTVDPNAPVKEQLKQIAKLVKEEEVNKPDS